MNYNDKNTKFIYRDNFKKVIFFNFFNFFNFFQTRHNVFRNYLRSNLSHLATLGVEYQIRAEEEWKFAVTKFASQNIRFVMRILHYVRMIIFIYGGSLNGLFHHGLVWSQIMYIYVRTTQRLYLRSEERSANALRNKHHYIFNCLLRSFK